VHFSIFYQQNHAREAEGHPDERWKILAAAHLPMLEGAAILTGLHTGGGKE